MKQALPKGLRLKRKARAPVKRSKINAVAAFVAAFR